MEIYIKEAAKRHGVTLKELGDKLRVSRQTIYFYIEQGAKNPLAKLEEIASAIGCDVNELFHNEGVCTVDSKTQHTCPHCGKPIRVTLE